MANYALRIPDSLFGYLKKLAEEERISMNQFIVTAVAEKVSALKTIEYLKERAQRANLKDFEALLDRVPDTPPLPGDELPDKAERAAHQPRAAYAAMPRRRSGGEKKPAARKTRR